MATYHPFAKHLGYTIYEPDDPLKPWAIIEGDNFYEGEVEWVENGNENKCRQLVNDKLDHKCETFIYHEWGTRECVVCRLIQNA